MKIQIDKAKDGMGLPIFKASFDKWTGEWESDEHTAMESLVVKIVKEYEGYQRATEADREKLNTIRRMFHVVG